MNSPLGRYAPLAAALASLFVLIAAGLIHVAYAMGIAATTDAFIDNLAILAFGVLIGQIGAHTEAVQQAAAKINGLESKVNENTARADKARLPRATAAEVAAVAENT